MSSAAAPRGGAPTAAASEAGGVEELKEPATGRKRLYLTCVILGMALTAPWNLLVSVLPRLAALHPPSAGLSVSLFSIFLLPSLPASFLLVIVGARLPLHVRLHASLLGAAACLVALPAAAPSLPGVLALAALLGVIGSLAANAVAPTDAAAAAATS
jgi:hypothetical protein